MFTPGPVGTCIRATGRKENDTDSAWKRRAGGFTEESGPTGSRAATESARARTPRPGTRAPGATGCRTDTAWRRTVMEVRRTELDSDFIFFFL